MDKVNIIASYCGSISAIIALAVLIIKPLRNRFVSWVTKTADRDNINQKIDNLTALLEKQIQQGEVMNEEIKKQSLALQATLRNSILDIYNARIKVGYMTMYEKQNVAELFKQYELLGGNCFVHDCVEQLNELPIKND